MRAHRTVRLFFLDGSSRPTGRRGIDTLRAYYICTASKTTDKLGLIDEFEFLSSPAGSKEVNPDAREHLAKALATRFSVYIRI
jgi:hypothetical protein